MEVEALLQYGLAESSDKGIRVPWVHWGDLVKLGLEVPRHWLPWSPFLLQIDSMSSLGREDFEYCFRFLLGSREVLLHRQGAVVQRAHHEGLYLLDPQTWALVEAMEQFNGLAPEARKGPDAWLRFAEIKDCAQTIGAQLDQYLGMNDVVVPSRIGLTVVEKANGDITFLPRCEGISKDAFERAFVRSTDDQFLFNLDGEDGQRVRVILGAPQRDALKRMRKVRNLRGAVGERLRRKPELAFEGILDQMEVAYARRVEGIGDWKPIPLPKGPSGVSFLEVEGLELGEEWDAEAEAEAMGYETYKVPVTVKSQDPTTGEPMQLRIENQPEARAFLSAMQEAQQAGASTFPFRGQMFSVDPQLRESMRSGAASGETDKSRKFLLIYTDEEEVRTEDVLQAQAAIENGPVAVLSSYEAPQTLSSQYPLKPHQKDAVAWLQRCARLSPERRGVLLADEMGLGKTLEILAFAAWCMEKGLFDGFHEGDGPYRPMLIVAPLMLVENETWQGDMHKFFAPDTFGPVMSLHGQALQDLRMARGKETELGKPLLDLEALQRHRVVITNYETITNFQHSFAQVREGRSIWSILVTDEAQEYKNPQARISHAVKALHPDFHIASTGTPVENRLLDIWNLFDALQPSLLGSARSFKQTYELPVEENRPQEALNDLRSALCYQEPQAFLLRREKTILADFPSKSEMTIPCPMSAHEVERHIRLLKALKQAGSRPGLHLSYLHRLVELYQHPLAHRDDFESIPTEELIRTSPKLQGVITRLHEIRDQNEKALVFARHIKIQRMLARVIGEIFGLQISIINGESGRGSANGPISQTQSGRQHRVQILQKFKDRQGFHVLVLSPFVAGVGLTITEANHVIHYGRWWNPAVESQATDRVYRIGQERDVQVHLPILWDPSGCLSASFDERLHELLTHKRELASDFLTPRESETSLASELCRNLTEEIQDNDSHAIDALTLENLSALPLDLFEAYVATVFTQNGYEVELLNQKHGGGLSVIAHLADVSSLIRITDQEQPEALKREYELLAELQWNKGKASKVLITRRASPDWVAAHVNHREIEIWSLARTYAWQKTPIDEMELIATQVTSRTGS
jgi:hypothetical protein